MLSNLLPEGARDVRNQRSNQHGRERDRLREKKGDRTLAFSGIRFEFRLDEQKFRAHIGEDHDEGKLYRENFEIDLRRSVSVGMGRRMSVALEQAEMRLIVGKVLEVFLFVADFHDLRRIEVA